MPDKDRRAVFLDRDGVLVKAAVVAGRPQSALSLEDFKLVDAAHEHLVRLKEAGFLLLVVSNQPDVGRGLLTPELLGQMNACLLHDLPVDHIYICPHTDADRCICRKPRPGLLLQAAAEHSVDLQRSYMIGDRWRDTEAGADAGCKTVFLDLNYFEQPSRVSPDVTVSSLGGAVDWILSC